VKPRRGWHSVCVICGDSATVEYNHAAGKNHIPWFKMPFCKRHHDQFHGLLRDVRLDLRYTTNKQRRLVIAALALNIALWMVHQALGESVSLLPEKKE
jgi:hypothetical protein